MTYNLRNGEGIYLFFSIVWLKFTLLHCSVRLAVDGSWCWFIIRKSTAGCLLASSDWCWFGVREKYCWPRVFFLLRYKHVYFVHTVFSVPPWRHHIVSEPGFTLPTGLAKPAGSGTGIPDRFDRKPIQTGRSQIWIQKPQCKRFVPAYRSIWPVYRPIWLVTGRFDW